MWVSPDHHFMSSPAELYGPSIYSEKTLKGDVVQWIYACLGHNKEREKIMMMMNSLNKLQLPTKTTAS